MGNLGTNISLKNGHGAVLVFHIYPSVFLGSPVSQSEVSPGTSSCFTQGKSDPWSKARGWLSKYRKASSPDQTAVPLHHSISLISKRA